MLLSSVVGAVIGITLIVFKGRDHSIPLAFGPYLAIAGGDRAVLRPDADCDAASMSADADVMLRRRTHRRHRQRQVRGGDAFAARGVDVVDADEIAHAISAPRRGGPSRRSSKRSARRSLRADGELDRAALRRRAFADPTFRARRSSSCCIR